MPKLHLLTTENYKTSKSKGYGWLTAILYLMPYKANSKGVNLCPSASTGCANSCLAFAGRVEMDKKNIILNARQRKTEMFLNDRDGFFALIRKDINTLIKYCQRNGYKLTVRLNGTSDLPILPLVIAKEFPTVQFYDYTKIPVNDYDARLKLSNYHLTFSRSESNWEDCKKAMQKGINVAAVFSTRGKVGKHKAQSLPKSYEGFKVLDGDNTDMRWQDKIKGAIVGLRMKGKTHRKKVLNNNLDKGFVIPVDK